jgi:hypothetical protein
MIIDNKLSASRQNPAAQPTRCIAKEPLHVPLQSSGSQSTLHASAVVRKAANLSSVNLGSGNVFKRLRQTGTTLGASSSATGSNRYSATREQPRNVQIDKRLNELKSQGGHNSSFALNKYQNQHQQAYEAMRASGALANATLNKSGQSLGLAKAK